MNAYTFKVEGLQFYFVGRIYIECPTMKPLSLQNHHIVNIVRIINILMNLIVTVQMNIDYSLLLQQ